MGGDVTINGNGHKLIGENHRGITVGAGTHLTLDNLTWTGENQRLIHNNGGTVTITNTHFDNLKIVDPTTSVRGAVIRNNVDGYIDRISGVTFNNNYVSTQEGTSQDLWGGLIYNGEDGASKTTAHIGSIDNSSFTNNVIYSYYKAPHGAVILNDFGSIDSITNNLFENNTMTSAADQIGGAHGVAIDNNEKGYIGVIANNTFRNNKTYRTGEQTSSENYHASGGAMDSYGYIENLVNNVFEGNSAESVASNTSGGAIMAVHSEDMDWDGHSSGGFGRFSGNTFINNQASTVKGTASGGAIIVSGDIDEFDGNTFIGNKAISVENSGVAIAGAARVVNVKSITNTKFIDNLVQSGAGQAQAGGLAISNGTVGKLSNVLFSGNKSIGYSAVGGGVMANGTIGTLTDVTFDGNEVISDATSARGGGMFVNGSVEGFNNALFKDNSATAKTFARGGGLYINSATTVGEIVNSNFINNKVEGDDTSNGGAIYSLSDVSVAADKGNSVFDGNTANGESNAIYMGTAGTNLNLRAANNGVMTFGDAIDGVEDGYNLNISGDASGKIVFDDNISHAAISHDDVTTLVSEGKYLGNENSLTMNSGVMQIGHLGTEDVSLKKLSLAGGQLEVMSADVDLAAKTMGHLDADDFEAGNGKIKVKDFNLLTDSTELETSVNFASDDMKSSVEGGTGTAEGKIYVYNTSYDEENGNFKFVRGAGNSAADYNKDLFGGDVFGLSALSGQEQVLQNMGSEYDSIHKDYSRGRVWALPYYQNADLDLSEFEGKSKNAGLLLGLDTKAFDVANGYKTVFTVFGGINKGETKFDSLKTETDSYTAGLKATLFNNLWYHDLMANYTHHDGEARLSGIKYDMDTDGYGLGWKSGFRTCLGYSPFELDGNVMLSWQHLDGMKYTTSKSVVVKTDDYERLMVSPMLKLGYYTDVVMPYVYARYNYILDDSGSSRADAVDLPSLNGKDYVEGGIGLKSVNAGPHTLSSEISRFGGGYDGWRVMLSYGYKF